MNGLRDLLKKKERLGAEGAQKQGTSAPAPAPAPQNLNVPEFTFKRTTTESEEVINPPDFSDEEAQPSPNKSKRKSLEIKSKLGFRRSSNAAITKDQTDDQDHEKLPTRPKGERRLSQRLHLHTRSRSSSAQGSPNLPSNLPDPPTATSKSTENRYAKEQREAQWEQRACALARQNPLLAHPPSADTHLFPLPLGHPSSAPAPRSRSPSISDARSDENILQAISLHEGGDLPLSTAMFGRLAHPRGENNALAQILYGLALRHGWGLPPEPERGVHYLSLAAASAANVEQEALSGGKLGGGAAKGELVLAVFELGNCFRYAWGVGKDPGAARAYYEVAAELGDVDSMEGVAWCFLEGFGGGKDKFRAVQYLRQAEEKGSTSVGNSWIWKEKYDAK